MAELKYAVHLNLGQNELQNAAMQILSSDPSGFEGHLYYNSSSNVLKFHNGTEYVSLSSATGDITGVTAGNGLTGGGSSGAVTLTVGAGDGITVNSGDVAVTAAQTTITSVKNTSLVIGRDSDNDIDFATDNNIIFRAGGADQIVLKDGVLEPVTDDDVDLGSSSKQFKNGYFDGTLEADAISINGTTITSTAAELNILDGVTSTAAELNILDGVTSTTAELNILDGVTSTTAELNILDGVTATAAEINIIDGNTSATSTTLVDADRVIVNDAGTMKQVAMTDIATYTNGSIEGTGALNSGSITSGFGAIDNGTSGIRSNNITAETAFLPDANDGAALGSASAAFSDLFLADGGTIQFGNDEEVRITHNADVGLTFSNENSGSAKPFVLTLESEEDAIVNTDVIAGIQFKAGDSDGTDAILPAAGIFAIATDTFGTASNRSRLVFSVAASETAGLTSGAFDGTVDMELDHSGKLTIQDDLVIGDDKTIGIASDTDLLTLGSGKLTVAGEVQMTTLDIGGTNVTATAAELNILDGVTATAAELNILDGKSFVDEDNMSSNSATAIASQQSIKAYVDGKTYDDVSVANLKTRLAGGFGSNAVQIGDSDDTITIPGNLVVSGTQTIQNETVQVVENNTILFEGSTDDANETKLTVVDPTADRTISLPNVSGTIPVLAAASTTQISSTPAELNLLDGSSAGTIVNSKGVIYGSSGEVNATTLQIGGTSITSTAAELNILDGVTATAAELNILDGVTSTAAELNILDGVTATTAEINLIDGGTSRGTTAVANGDGFLHNDGGTMRMTNVSKLADLFAGTNITASNSVLSVANAADDTKGVVELATTAEALAGSDTSRAVTPAGLAARSYRETIGDASATAFNIDHNLGTRDVIVQVYDASSYETCVTQVVRSTTNRVVVTFNSAPASNDAIVLVTKVD